MLEIIKRFDLNGHNDSIYGLGYSLYTDDVYTAGNDGSVIGWDVHSGKGRMVARAENSIYCIKLIDRDILAVGENFKGIRILDLKEHKETHFYPINGLQIFDIFSNDECIMAACSKGWIYTISKKENSHKKIQFSKNNVRTIDVGLGNTIIVGYSDGYIRVHDINSMEIINEFKAHDKSVFKVLVMPNKKWLLSVGRDARIKTWGLEKNYAPAGEIPGHHYAINSISLSNDSKHFVTCSMDKTLKLWNTLEGKLLKVIDGSRFGGHTSSVNNVKWLKNNLIASCGDDKRLIIWEISGLD